MSWLRSLLLHRRLDREMHDEMRQHLDRATERLMARGMPAEEARMAARREFGNVPYLQEEARDARGARPFSQIRISALDVKLGIRMLVKYRWLSAVALIGMTVAIAIGAGAFGFLAALFDTSLPLDQPERVISIQHRDIRQGLGNRQRAGDFLQWRGALRTVKDLAAFSDDRRNLIIPGRVPEPVDIAEMTASGFRVARTAPLRGRALLDEDERPDAPPVVVIAYDEWQHRFDGDSGVIGRQVRLGGEIHTVVGVMPEGFHFPIRHHFWTALRLPGHAEPGSGLPLRVPYSDALTPA